MSHICQREKLIFRLVELHSVWIPFADGAPHSSIHHISVHEITEICGHFSQTSANIISLEHLKWSILTHRSHSLQINRLTNPHIGVIVRKMIDELKMKWKSVNATDHRKQAIRIERKNCAHFLRILLSLGLSPGTIRNNECTLFDSSAMHTHTHAYWWRTYGTRYEYTLHYP